MRTNILIGTLCSGDEFPARDRVFPPLPFDVAGQQVEKIEFRDIVDRLMGPMVGGRLKVMGGCRNRIDCRRR